MEIAQLLLTGLIVLASFAGGLVAVLIGQFFSYYRDQRDGIEELYYNVEAIKHLDSDLTPYSVNLEDLAELESSFKRLYLKNRWWMDTELRQNTGELVHSVVVLRSAVKTREKIKRKERDLDSSGFQKPSAGNINIYNNVVEEHMNEIDLFADEILSQFHRVPFRNFLYRYLGIVTVDASIRYTE